MANTEESPVFLGKSDAKQTTPHDDAFAVRDGHFVGHEGFVVPSSFNEFYQRFPTYVADWVGRRVRGCVSATEAEDWTQELLLHLAALPLCSKHRRDGKEDVIQTFAPERMHGANEARFRSFINQCLGNKFNTLYAKWRKRPLSNPGNLSLEVETEKGGSDEFCYASSEYLRQAGCRSSERQEQRFRLEEFVHLAASEIPGLSEVVRVFRRTGNWGETEEVFSRSRCAAIRRRARREGLKLGRKLGQNLVKESRHIG
jgi:hypothetical protein